MTKQKTNGNPSHCVILRDLDGRKTMKLEIEKPSHKRATMDEISWLSSQRS
jgi:hypothetical protein